MSNSSTSFFANKKDLSILGMAYFNTSLSTFICLSKNCFAITAAKRLSSGTLTKTQLSSIKDSVGKEIKISPSDLESKKIEKMIIPTQEKDYILSKIHTNLTSTIGNSELLIQNIDGSFKKIKIHKEQRAKKHLRGSNPVEDSIHLATRCQWLSWWLNHQ